MKIRVTNIKHMGLRRLAIIGTLPILFLVTFPLALLSNILHLAQTAHAAWTQREPLPEQCEVGLVGHAIVIRMPFDLLAHAAANAPCMHHIDPDGRGTGGFRVTDPTIFAFEVQRALLNELDETGGTLVHEMFDDAIEKVVDDGGEGFEWPAAGIHD